MGQRKETVQIKVGEGKERQIPDVINAVVNSRAGKF